MEFTQDEMAIIINALAYVNTSNANKVLDRISLEHPATVEFSRDYWEQVRSIEH